MATTPERPSGTVTFLFTDIEGSTRLLQELGDDWAGVLHVQRRLMRSAIAANKAVYEEKVRAPMGALIAELAAELGEGRIYRPYRDVRFSRDKTPYKTNLAADLAIRTRREGENEHGIPGLYFSFGLDGEYLGIGAWHMSPSVLAAYRNLLDHATRGAQVQRMVDDLLGHLGVERVAQVSDRHGDNVQFLLGEQRGGQANRQEQATGGFQPIKGHCGDFHVQGVSE